MVMDQSRKNRSHQSAQQQQQHQQQQIQARMKGATRILSGERQSSEQEQHIGKQSEHSATNMDTSYSLTSNSNQSSHVGAPGNATLERSNTDVNTASNTGSCNQQHPNNSNQTSTSNLLYMNEIDPPTSSLYTGGQSNSSMTSASTALAPIISAATTANVIASHQQLHSQQHQQQQYDSPQIQPYDIKSLFECPICFDYAVPPIYQCQNGHLVCQSCSHKIAHCPTCRVPITEPSIRNLQLDKLANQFQFPCKYNFVGCQWKSYWFKKREHEEVCDYISYSCPCPGTSCKWTGLLAQVMPHLSEHHKSITTLSGEDIVFLATDINLKGAVDWVMIQSCFNQHFLLVLEKQELKNGQQQFFAIVQLIGTPKEAEKFKYKLELSSHITGKAKRLQWEATPRSILDGIQFAISNYDCLVFDSRMAQHFLSPIKRDVGNKAESCSGDNSNGGQSENLGINVTIERTM